MADVAAKLWDSWEDGAVVRDAPTGRFLDRDKLHHVDFTGEAFSVRGPALAPRPPQGHPVRVVDATEGPARSTAVRHADVALVHVASPAQARTVRDRLRADAAAAGRDPNSLLVLVSLLIDLGDGEHAAEPGHGGGGPRQTAQGPLYRGGPVDLADLIASWYKDGTADGFHLIPVEPRRDLERLVNGTVALLQHRGLFRTFYPGSTLREHLGLARPANQYAGERHERTPAPGPEAARQALPSGRVLPRRRHPHRLDRPRREVADRVLLLRAPRPDRRTRSVRLLPPRRGAAAARTPGRYPRPGRGSTAPSRSPSSTRSPP